MTPAPATPAGPVPVLVALGRDRAPVTGARSRREQWGEVYGLATAQHALVTGPQVRGLGFSRRALGRALESGRLLPYRFGVHLVAGAPVTDFTPLMAACLAVAPCVAASFRSAAILHGLPGVAPAPGPEITVYREGSRRLSGVVTHRSDFLDPADLDVVRGIPVTSAARTVVDLGRYVSHYVLVMALDHAKRRHLCSYEEVGECLERIGGRGRPGSGYLRDVLARRL